MHVAETAGQRGEATVPTGPRQRSGTVPDPASGSAGREQSGTESPAASVPTLLAVPVPVPGRAAAASASRAVPDRGPKPDPPRRRELTDDELNALVPIAREAAAKAEGRLTRDSLRAGLKAQNIPINNTALGQLLRELKEIEGKPPPARR